MGHDDARGSLPTPVGKPTEPRVDAGMKELNEMTIGRTDDPENPCVATALSRLHVWDWIAEPIWASGHELRKQAGHMIAVDPHVKLLMFSLASEGPFSNRVPPVNSLLLA